MEQQPGIHGANKQKADLRNAQTSFLYSLWTFI
jgi:hypothetical protein